jgi:hypothetical protein
MPNTTPMVPALESLPLDFLLGVSGGCKKKCPPPAPVQQTQIVQPPPPPPPMVGPPPQVQPSGDQVSTSVVINGQRQA